MEPRKDGLCWWGDGSCPNEQTNRSWYCSEHEKRADERRAALDRMTQEAVEAGLYDKVLLPENEGRD